MLGGGLAGLAALLKAPDLDTLREGRSYGFNGTSSFCTPSRARTSHSLSLLCSRAVTPLVQVWGCDVTDDYRSELEAQTAHRASLFAAVSSVG